MVGRGSTEAVLKWPGPKLPLLEQSVIKSGCLASPSLFTSPCLIFFRLQHIVNSYSQLKTLAQKPFVQLDMPLSAITGQAHGLCSNFQYPDTTFGATNSSLEDPAHPPSVGSSGASGTSIAGPLNSSSKLGEEGISGRTSPAGPIRSPATREVPSEPGLARTMTTILPDWHRQLNAATAKGRI